MPDAGPNGDGNGDLNFDCPRCHRPATASTYGPCPDCRAQLRATVGAEPRQVEVAAFEPKMNVVPNAVALKE
jgi:hypothetical protein